MEKLPSNVISEEILPKLGLETLCSVACVDRSLRFTVDSQILPSLSSLDLSANTPDEQTLYFILSRCSGLSSVSINCRRLYDSSLFLLLLRRNLRELNFLCCSFLSYEFLAHIGQNCPNLRVIMLQLVAKDSLNGFRANLAKMLSSCAYLESFCLKIRGIEVSDFKSTEFVLPRTIKTLKLNPVLEHHAFQLINDMRVGGNSSNHNDFSVPLLPSSGGFTLTSLSLVLNVISDRLLRTITNFFPLLVELDLEDKPNKEPLPYHDLTNNGLQSLSSCHRLTALSIIRGRQNHHVSFKRVNDMGMFLLSEGCRALESVRLCGFSKVSDAGFASILYSLNLKKFEVRNALLLSDLAFHDFAGSPCALVEVRLLSCSLITSEAVKKLAYSRSLEMLDLCGCKSIADLCLNSISHLHKLTILNLTGADITDRGLYVLGQGSTPITHLCLRSCKRVTDKGISHLVHSGGIIRQTLSTLDLGHMPGISDKAILTIAKACRELTELCIRNCFHVTDSSVEALATNGEPLGWSRQLQRLDMSNCTGLSGDSLRFLRRPFFRRLHWLGIGRTRLASKQNAALTEICNERPWLCVCLDDCEIGCHDGWHFHRSEGH